MRSPELPTDGPAPGKGKSQLRDDGTAATTKQARPQPAAPELPGDNGRTLLSPHNLCLCGLRNNCSFLCLRM